jgi:hypothetical protein
MVENREENRIAVVTGMKMYLQYGVLIVLKSGSPNLLEPSGHLEACNGVDLPSFTM